MDCAQTRNYLHSYLDRELDPVAATAIEQHLQTCAACQHAYAQQSSLQTAVKKHAAYYQASDALARRIRAGVSGAAGTKPVRGTPPRWQWLQLGAAVAATAVVSWTAAIQWESAARDETIVDEVIASHARSSLTGHLADVASSDQHTVKPWLSSKLDVSPPVPDLTTAGYPRIGGRLDYLDHRPVAALAYRHRQHVINVFIWPDPKSGAAISMQTVSRQGYNLLHWRDAGMNFWMISDLNPAEIKTFAQTLAAIK
jgi:anti-sigma factor RsiW